MASYHFTIIKEKINWDYFVITGKFVFHRHPREFVNGRVGQVLKSIGQASIKNTLVNSSLYPCLSRNPPFSNSSTSSVVNSLSYGAEPAAIGSGFGCESTFSISTSKSASEVAFSGQYSSTALI
ncbi:MAG: hypothetical protein WB975_08525 [Nitrososphaeraceae archaeon]